MLIHLRVNGINHELDIDPAKRLLDILREDLELTGTKEGCSEGECGACTVIMNGKAVNSCMVLGIQARDKEILTIEYLDQDGELDKLQKSFIKKGAVQCGFCTPGMLMSCKALLMKNSSPTSEDIKRAIEGNLCRCTGYTKIIEAVIDAITLER